MPGQDHPTDEAAVEAVAQAIFTAETERPELWKHLSCSAHARYYKMAREGIKALDHAIAEGMKSQVNS